MGKRLGVPRGVLGGLFELESKHKADVWGGDKRKYFGTIQFGEGARRETGLNPRIHTTIESQEPYILKYFQQRGYNPGDYPDLPSRARALYRTVLVGNPRQSGTDSFGTNSDKAALRMLPGGDLYQRAEARYSLVPGGGGGGSAQPPAAPRTPSPGVGGSEAQRQLLTGGGARKAADPFLATALAGLQPQFTANPITAELIETLQRMAGVSGTPGFGAVLRGGIAPLSRLGQQKAQDDISERMASAIFGLPSRRAQGQIQGEALAPFDPSLSTSAVGETPRLAMAASTDQPPGRGPTKNGIVEFLHGDRSKPGYREDHGGENWHVHVGVDTPATAKRLMDALIAGGVKVTENPYVQGRVGGHSQNSLHYQHSVLDGRKIGLAFDIPGAQVPVGQENTVLLPKVQSILDRVLAGRE